MVHCTEQRAVLTEKSDRLVQSVQSVMTGGGGNGSTKEYHHEMEKSNKKVLGSITEREKEKLR